MNEPVLGLCQWRRAQVPPGRPAGCQGYCPQHTPLLEIDSHPAFWRCSFHSLFPLGSVASDKGAQAPHLGQTVCTRLLGILGMDTRLCVSIHPFSRLPDLHLTTNSHLWQISNLIPGSRKEHSLGRSLVDYYPIEVTQ